MKSQRYIWKILRLFEANLINSTDARKLLRVEEQIRAAERHHRKVAGYR